MYPWPVMAEPVSTLDVRGLRCPVPVVRTRETLATLPEGARLDVIGDDPLIRIDMNAFCGREGHDLLGEEPQPGGAWRFSLRRVSK